MDFREFRGKITTITADGGAAYVELDQPAGTAKFAILNHRKIGTAFEFKVGLEVVGKGRVWPEAIKATEARPAVQPVLVGRVVHVTPHPLRELASSGPLPAKLVG